MEKFVLAAKCLIVFVALTIVICCSCYRYQISPVDKNDDTKKEIIVPEGSTWYTISESLIDNNLIRSDKFYKIYIKLFRPGNLEAGKYFLSPNMNLDQIVAELESGNAYNMYDVSVTFREGLNMRAIAKLISDNTNNSEDDVYNLLNDDEYLDELINTYWFINEDIKNDKIYYSIEGYLFPETYVINKKSSVKDIFKIMLDEMDKKLTPYKNDINNSNFNVHQILTLASIIELESGTSNDRALVSGVFYNRLNTKGETLGSDVTGYYGAKMDDWSKGLGKAKYECNGYNTRLESTCPISGLPVGPICNPSIESIKAALSPHMTDNYFFVADCSGKTYLSKTNSEHEAIIAKLKSENNWCDN